MGLDSKSWWSRFCSPKKKEQKTVNILFGFFLIVNLCLGTGFLGIPYAFFYSGYLAAVPTMIFISLISWVNANYLLEVMARAQALEYLDKLQNPTTDSDITDEETDRKELTSSFLQEIPSPKEHPKFEITTSRKFEVAELCDIFFNRYLKYAYLVLLSLHSFLARWSFAAVAGSAWAVNIPFRNFGAVEMCSEDAFLHNTIPSGGCLYAYYISLTIFGVIVVTLSLFDIKEQAFIQFVLGVLRFITVAALVIYCIVRLSVGGDACLDDPEMANFTSPINVGMSSIVYKFNPRGWLLAIPIFTYAFIIHTGISSLTHPIKQKKYLHWLLVAILIGSLLCYMSLGIVVPLWFRASIQETATLNWAIFTRTGQNLSLRFLSYYLILFPSLDVISAYPLINHVIVNNLYIFITGHDTSKDPKYRFDRMLRVGLRVINAILPILAAFGVANLIYVLKYAGLVGFMCFTFPVILQLKSIAVCKKRFASLHISLSGGGGHSQESIDDKEVDGKDLTSPTLEKKEILSSSDDSKSSRALYMTSYSYSSISHPVVVCVVGAAGVFLCFLAFFSLFLHPRKLTCDLLAESFYQ